MTTPYADLLERLDELANNPDFEIYFDGRMCKSPENELGIEAATAIRFLQEEISELQRINAMLENDCNMLSLDRQELQERLAGYEWQPIETAPKDGTQFLALKIGFEPAIAHWESDKWLHTTEEDHCEELCWDGARLVFYTPEVWMPLPKPPAKEGTKS